jgi:hypothetical protein
MRKTSTRIASNQLGYFKMKEKVKYSPSCVVTVHSRENEPNPLCEIM